MDKILDFLKSETGTLVLFFTFLIIVFVIYFIVQSKKKPSEKMRDEKRVLTLPDPAEPKTTSEKPITEEEPSSAKGETKVVESVKVSEEKTLIKEEENVERGEDPYAAIKYSYSYYAHLTVAPLESQKRYNEIKKFIMTYEGINPSITFKEERFIYLGKTIIKFRIISNVLRIYLALSAEEIKTINIKSKDLSTMKEHERTPSLIRISGNTGVKRAIEAITLLMEKQNINKLSKEHDENYIPEEKSVEELISLDYIRIKK